MQFFLKDRRDRDDTPRKVPGFQMNRVVIAGIYYVKCYGAGGEGGN